LDIKNKLEEERGRKGEWEINLQRKFPL